MITSKYIFCAVFMLAWTAFFLSGCGGERRKNLAMTEVEKKEFSRYLKGSSL
jgi:hypothetical protein